MTNLEASNAFKLMDNLQAAGVKIRLHHLCKQQPDKSPDDLFVLAVAQEICHEPLP